MKGTTWGGGGGCGGRAGPKGGGCDRVACDANLSNTNGGRGSGLDQFRSSVGEEAKGVVSG